MSILILGANGMLGRMLVDVIGKDQDIVAFDRNDVDITDYESIRRGFARAKPTVVINAAAYTDVDGAETHEELANRVNGEAVGFLAQACIEHDATFVHYSTDYVFDGFDARGYDEDAESGPAVNAYGRSKLLGEQKLIAASETGKLHYYLIRTSWLYGPWGKNFVDTMLKLGSERDEIRVVDDQYGKPTYTYDLAHATREILEAEEEYESGIYHITNETSEGGITWFTLAKEIFRLTDMPVNVTPCSSGEFTRLAVARRGSPGPESGRPAPSERGRGAPQDGAARPAKRPAFSVLVNTKLFERRAWNEALEEYLRVYALA